MTKHESLQWFEPMFNVPFLGLSQLTSPKEERKRRRPSGNQTWLAAKQNDVFSIVFTPTANSICGTALVKVNDIL